MRKELENIERIERYLSKEMNPSEKVAFEKEMEDYPDLKEAVALQKDLQKTFIRIGEKKVIRAGLKSYLFETLLIKSLIGLFLVSSVSLGAYFIFNKDEVKMRIEIQRTNQRKKLRVMKSKSQNLLL